MVSRSSGTQSTPRRPPGWTETVDRALRWLGLLTAACLVVVVGLPLTGVFASPGTTAATNPNAVSEHLPTASTEERDDVSSASPRKEPAQSSPTPSEARTKLPASRSTAPTPERAAPEPAAPKRVAPKRLKVPVSGSGRFRTATVSAPVSGKPGKLLRFSVRVERGLPLDPDSTARSVARILSDSRSWTGSGRWRMQLVGSAAAADFSVLVATPATTDRMCRPLRTWGQLSCQRGNRAVLNARRWAFGAKAYGKQVAAYRVYLVNHEVGHVLGHTHARCPADGRRAPVMLQQTKGLQGCRANPWPSPGRR
jgi:hypothetical protein